MKYPQTSKGTSISSRFSKVVTTPPLVAKRIVDMDVRRGMIMVTNPKARVDELKREFTFDAVYDWK